MHALEEMSSTTTSSPFEHRFGGSKGITGNIVVITCPYRPINQKIEGLKTKKPLHFVVKASLMCIVVAIFPSNSYPIAKLEEIVKYQTEGLNKLQ